MYSKLKIYDTVNGEYILPYFPVFLSLNQSLYLFAGS